MQIPDGEFPWQVPIQSFLKTSVQDWEFLYDSICEIYDGNFNDPNILLYITIVDKKENYYAVFIYFEACKKKGVLGEFRKIGDSTWCMERKWLRFYKRPKCMYRLLPYFDYRKQNVDDNF